MAFSCPDCGQVVSSSAAKCRSCGADLSEVAPPPPKSQNDAAKYAIIIGVLVTAIVILVAITGMMGGDSNCGDCVSGKKKVPLGYKLCDLCKGNAPVCGGCNGAGKDPQNYSTCQRCGGKGTADVCVKCKGEPKKKCPTCNGTKKIAK